MKAEDIKVGRTYVVIINKEPLVCTVRDIFGEGRDMRYDVTDKGSNKTYAVLSAANFKKEVIQKPKEKDLVHIVVAVGEGSLDESKVYRVKEVGKKDCKLAYGKKTLTVPLSDVRVVDATTERKTVEKEHAPSREEMTEFILSKTMGDVAKDKVHRMCDLASVKKLKKMYSDMKEGGKPEGEEGSDPTKTTQCAPSAQPFPAAAVTQSSIKGDAIADDLFLDTLLADANSDSETSGDSHIELVQRAVDAGFSVRDAYTAESWNDVVRMIRSRYDNRTIHENQVDDETGFEGEIPEYARGGTTRRDNGVPTDPQERKIVTAYEGFVQDPIAPSRNNPTPNNGLSRGSATLTRIPVSLSERLAPKVHTDDSPHLIVEARAGTGKTTTLVAALQLLMGEEPRDAKGNIITPSTQQQAVWDSILLSRGKVKSVAFCAFNNSIADELKRRVPPGVVAMTMHSMGYAAVRQAFGRSVKLEGGRIGNILSELMEQDIRVLRKNERTFAVIQAVEQLVGLCKMNLTVLGEDAGEDAGADYPVKGVDDWLTREVEALDALCNHYEVEIADYDREKVYELVPQVIERCKDVRADMEIDFNDMIWLPVALNLPVTKYDVLLVDEAQDLNRCQQALAKMAGHRLILCGDPRQAIYGFAGADADSMPRMARELGACTCGADRTGPSAVAHDVGCPAHRGCNLLPLTVTRRCGKAIVDEARKLVPDFDAFETNGGGKISRLPYTDKNSKLTAEEKKMNPPDDYSRHVLDGDFILCRVNAPLVSQCFRFLKQGRRAHIQGRDIGQGLVKLVIKFGASDVVDLVKKLSNWHHGERKKENAKRNPNEARLIAIDDKHDCLIAFTEGMTTVDDVVKCIESVFQDEEPSKPRTGIRLSSIHRAKGLEAKRVFLLEPEGSTVPHPMAKSDWQRAQEWNLRYVAITRAIEELIYVS